MTHKYPARRIALYPMSLLPSWWHIALALLLGVVLGGSF